jgi:hypothetical protein
MSLRAMPGPALAGIAMTFCMPCTCHALRFPYDGVALGTVPAGQNGCGVW